MFNFIVMRFKNTFLFWVVCFAFQGIFSQGFVVPGAHQTNRYLPLLEGKKIGLVAHQASTIGAVHLVDSLLASKVNLVRVFAPEHGFRGKADAGEKVADQKDAATGLSIISLYGKNRKPPAEMLQDLDLMVFDLQDVGVRFYTYLSTLHYVMEACAEQNIPLLVLDRPNPNAHYVDGPVLNMEFKSFVGMHPVPIVYGLTIGEYAQMINGEHWLNEQLQCDLTVIPIENYTHNTPYTLPVKPSPNLPNAQAVALYPSLCLLEPTVISVGRGTDKQFQIYGHPSLPTSTFSFTPQSNEGAKNPKFKGIACNGKDLSTIEPPKGIALEWLIEAYQQFEDKEHFFLKGFTRIAGTDLLQKQIEKGYSPKQIKNSWEKELKAFKHKRKKYVLYP